MLWVNELRDQEWRRSVGDGNAKSQEEPANDEEGDVETQRQKQDSDEHDRASDHNTCSSSEQISAVGYKGNGQHGANGHRCSDQSKNRRTGVVEVVPPLGHALQTVDEGTIVSWVGQKSVLHVPVRHAPMGFFKLTDRSSPMSTWQPRGKGKGHACTSSSTK